MSESDWPPPAWRALYREIGAALDSDPASPAAQALADRWLTLTKQLGLTSASLKERLAEANGQRETAFINDALWVRWANEQEARARAGGRGVPQASESRRALFQRFRTLLGVDPSDSRAQALAQEWRALLDAETGGDEEIKADAAGLVQRRRNWPAGMKRYIASLYATDADTWERVTDFIEAATTRYTPSDRRP